MEEVDETDVESQCVTPMGRRLLRNWFLRPVLDLEKLNIRLDTLSFFRCAEELLVSLRQTLKSVKDIPHILKSICSLLHINKIFEVGISETLREQLKHLNLDIIEKVMGVIDVNRSKDKGYDTIVKDGFCGELDELRQIYEELPEFLEEDKLNLIFPDKLGCHLLFTGTAPNFYSFSPLYIEEWLQYEFSDEDGDSKKFFYRTAKTRELDDLLGDIYITKFWQHKYCLTLTMNCRHITHIRFLVENMERAITRDLVSHVLQFSDPLLKAVTFTAELDCSLSLALVARQNNYVRPILTSESVLDIRNGRHVLQEMTVDTFIPNDTKILDEGTCSELFL
ncbi:DNA mismatch repair protein MSH5 [Sesamum angolense]|uniref:DNA mismatch repair protein MSH5 n=1 Tax=Sesamum angolense TaxID=2727404 RepID=A0AAE2BV75_9LAMI|nr:DNA mismatch repair protein MSH5 [Sesamum angolense]